MVLKGDFYGSTVYAGKNTEILGVSVSLRRTLTPKISDLHPVKDGKATFIFATEKSNE
jgi:hypothetical protein